MKRQAIFYLCLLLLITGLSKLTIAEETPEKKLKARQLFEQGVSAFEKENYPDALWAFKESYSLNPKLSVLYNIGMCQKALFDFTGAIMTLRKYLEEAGGKISPKEKSSIERTISEMENSLGKISIKVSEDKAEVFIDKESAGFSPLTHFLSVNPGKHTISIRKEGFKPVEREIVVKTQETLFFEFNLIPESQKSETAEKQVSEKSILPSEVKPQKHETLLPSHQEATKPEFPEKEKSKKKKGVLRSPLFWSLLGIAVIGGASAGGVLIWKSVSQEETMKDADLIVYGR